jgi:hypothetical protein
MNQSIAIFFFLFFVVMVAGQSDKKSVLLRSTLGVSGGSFVLPAENRTYIIHHSIGQVSPINLAALTDNLIIQGFIHPFLLLSTINQESHLDRIAIIFPNPFKQSFILSFLEKINTPLEVSIFTLQGQQVYTDQFAKSQRIDIQLPILYSAKYILNVKANNQQFSRIIIKN